MNDPIPHLHTPEAAVVSGAPYLVHSVNGRVPTDLDDFLSDEPVTIIARFHAQEADICGTTVRAGDVVTMYEKDCSGSGRDVRTWQICMDRESFVATERSLF